MKLTTLLYKVLKLVIKLVNCNLIQVQLIPMFKYIYDISKVSLKTKKYLVLCKIVIYTYLVISILRCNFIAFCLQKNFDLSAYFYFDPILEHAHKTLNFFDPNLFFTFGLTIWYGIFIDYAIYFNINEKLLVSFNEILVLNLEQFFALNPHLKINPNIISQLATIFKNNIIEKRTDFYYNHIKFKHNSLKSFSGVSRKIRVKIALWTLWTNVNVAMTLSVIALANGLLLSYYLFTFYHKLSALQSVIALLDITLNIYCSWNGNRMGMFGLNFVIVLFFVHHSHIRYLNQRLQQLTQLENLNPSSLIFFLRTFYHDHLSILKSYIETNQQIVSPLLFVSILSQFGFNIWLITFVVKKSAFLLLGEKIFFFCLLVVQTAMALMTCQTFVHTEILHSSESLLFKAQFALRGSIFRNGSCVLREKIKLMAYYEQMNSNNKKFSFTFGPLGKLSKNSILQVCKLVLNNFFSNIVTVYCSLSHIFNVFF